MNLKIEDLDIRACYTADAFSVWAERVRKGYLSQEEWRNQTYNSLMMFYNCLIETISVRHVDIAQGATATPGVWEMIIGGITCVPVYCKRPMFSYLIKIGAIHQHGSRYGLYKADSSNKTSVVV